MPKRRKHRTCFYCGDSLDTQEQEDACTEACKQMLEDELQQLTPAQLLQMVENAYADSNQMLSLECFLETIKPTT